MKHSEKCTEIDPIDSSIPTIHGGQIVKNYNVGPDKRYMYSRGLCFSLFTIFPTWMYAYMDIGGRETQDAVVE